MNDTLTTQRHWIHGIIRAIRNDGGGLDFGRTVKNPAVYLWAFGSLWKFSRPTKHAPIVTLVVQDGRWQSPQLFGQACPELETLLFWDAEQDSDPIANPPASVTWGWAYDEQGDIVLTPPPFLTDPRILGDERLLSTMYRLYQVYMKTAWQFPQCQSSAFGWVEGLYMSDVWIYHLETLTQWGYLEAAGGETESYLWRFNPTR